MRSTDEQHAVVEAVRTGKPIKAKAYAGAGRTSTLRLAADALEWNRVRLAGDFRFRQGDDAKLTMPAEDKRLFYVGATRAKQLLDTSDVHRDIQRVFLDAGV
ncbi:3'-5' exonuclease [Cupriavidus sp. D39]|uniref:3'-5' exonuclease n=1 Tax=Cupriavidus sp. D39 TaxID=2997877 RepID=UPI00226E1892|nr:3'-5' exonuclease [Cupriavidus sp. D39]MCY0852432.1 hypothetical protein [Cupriavidus sp. D39]